MSGIHRLPTRKTHGRGPQAAKREHYESWRWPLIARQAVVVSRSAVTSAFGAECPARDSRKAVVRPARVSDRRERSRLALLVPTTLRRRPRDARAGRMPTEVKPRRFPPPWTGEERRAYSRQGQRFKTLIDIAASPHGLYQPSETLTHPASRCNSSAQANT